MQRPTRVRLLAVLCLCTVTMTTGCLFSSRRTVTSAQPYLPPIPHETPAPPSKPARQTTETPAGPQPTSPSSVTQTTVAQKPTPQQSTTQPDWRASQSQKITQLPEVQSNPVPLNSDQSANPDSTPVSVDVQIPAIPMLPTIESTAGKEPAQPSVLLPTPQQIPGQTIPPVPQSMPPSQPQTVPPSQPQNTTIPRSQNPQFPLQQPVRVNPSAPGDDGKSHRHGPRSPQVPMPVGSHLRANPTANGYWLNLQPNEHPMERVVEMTKKIDTLTGENIILMNRIRVLEARALEREQAMAEMARDNEEALRATMKSLEVVKALRAELATYKQKLTTAQESEALTLQLVIRELEKLLNEKGP